MPQRHFYLAAYDVSNARRLAAALALVRGYAASTQKSVHEIFLSPGECRELLRSMTQLLDPEADRFMLLRLDPRARSHALGRAAHASDSGFFYVG